MSDTTWPTLYELALDLAKQIGMPCSSNTRSPVVPGRDLGWAWDGHLLHGRHPNGHPHEPHALFHEMGHWLCAEPLRRSAPDFGVTNLGEEHAAYLVSIILQHLFEPNRGPPPVLHDGVDMVAFYRAATILLSVGVELTPRVTFEARRKGSS